MYINVAVMVISRKRERVILDAMVVPVKKDVPPVLIGVLPMNLKLAIVTEALGKENIAHMDAKLYREFLRAKQVLYQLQHQYQHHL